MHEACTEKEGFEIGGLHSDSTKHHHFEGNIRGWKQEKSVGNGKKAQRRNSCTTIKACLSTENLQWSVEKPGSFRRHHWKLGRRRSSNYEREVPFHPQLGRKHEYIDWTSGWHIDCMIKSK